MEIYRNQPTTVKVRAPIPDATYTVKIRSPRPLGEVYETAGPLVAPELDASWGAHILSIPIEFVHTWYDGTVEIVITVNGGLHTYSEYVDVVTPLFTSVDLGSEYPAAQVPELERLVRKVVEAYTGQYFGKTVNRYPVSATERIINFDVPLIEFTGVSDRYLTNSTTLTPPKLPYELINDGFTLMVDFENYHIKTDSTWLLTKDARDEVYVIEGTFGYNSVPADVKQAALLIAGVWGCKQAVWRDRFIQTMRSADWSVGYHDNAFKNSTGSITADQLLEKYHRRYQPEVF